MADKLTLDRGAMKDRSTSHLRIYVGNLNENATQDELYEIFSSYGNVQGIAINRGFGFVQFEEEKSAIEAISKANGHNYLGKNLVVKTAQTNADKAKREETQSKPELPPAVALNDTNAPEPDVDSGDYYDEYGNYIGDNGGGGGGWEERDVGNEYWRGGAGGRGRGGRGARGRGRGARGGPGGFRDRSPHQGRGDWADHGERGGYERYPPAQEFPRALPVPERNDCEIIVVSKALTEYAEYIEGRLKRLGIVVDLLFPMEDVPIGKVLGNIASRGCLYAILVMPQNQEHRSLTLNILHGLPQEHRNMPVEDALLLISRNFQEVQRGGGAGGREAVFALLGQLADGKSLTALQYDKVIKYLQDRREHQVKIELGEPLETDKTHVDLQQRIMSILNDSKKPEPVPIPAQQPTQQKLLNDPTVRKALDSILQKFV